jgi:6-hydroxynicotinate reductase
VTENPVNLTRSVKDTLTYVSSGGAPVFVWPGGGITFMVDVTRMPDNSFGYVPTPAIVAPIEFTLRLEDYRVLGGHMADVVKLEDVQGAAERRSVAHVRDNPWPMAHNNFRW